MGKIKIELNEEGITSLLCSKEMSAICQEEAAKIQAKCGSGYERGAVMGTDRIKATVYADSMLARIDNSRNNTILKAVGACLLKK